MTQTGVTIIGDEVESVLAAVSAKRAGAEVTLVRRSTGWLGGLSTRGGLSYMDITPEYLSPLFGEFLQKAGVVRVALNPERADSVLHEMLADVRVLDGVTVEQAEFNHDWFLTLSDGRPVQTRVLIDSTPDADVARMLGTPYLMGLGGVLGERQNYLGVSPVFRIEGVPVPELQAFEACLRARPDIHDVLNKALPYHPAELREEYVTRPTFAPEEMDYLDILNPTIGIYYHRWRTGEVESYPQAPIVVDGGNISRLADGSLGFNGLVCRLDRLLSEVTDREATDKELFDALLDFSHGAPVPDFLLAEMEAFEAFLQSEGGLREAKVVPPQELYVRQTLTLLSRHNMTAEHILRGGVPANKAIGTFSYWLDLRGAELWQVFPGEKPPKPVFNVGLDVALPNWPRLENFAFVSRAAGYSPIGQGAGRIVQHNSLLGEGLGIAAALAALGNRPLSRVAGDSLPQIRDILAHRQGRPLELTGHATWSEIEIVRSKLLQADNRAVARLRERVAEGFPLT